MGISSYSDVTSHRYRKEAMYDKTLPISKTIN